MEAQGGLGVEADFPQSRNALLASLLLSRRPARWVTDPGTLAEFAALAMEGRHPIFVLASRGPSATYGPQRLVAIIRSDLARAVSQMHDAVCAFLRRWCWRRQPTDNDMQRRLSPILSGPSCDRDRCGVALLCHALCSGLSQDIALSCEPTQPSVGVGNRPRATKQGCGEATSIHAPLG